MALPRQRPSTPKTSALMQFGLSVQYATALKDLSTEFSEFVIGMSLMAHLDKEFVNAGRMMSAGSARDGRLCYHLV